MTKGFLQRTLEDIEPLLRRPLVEGSELAPRIIAFIRDLGHEER